jgi:NADH-quinone oxidoreductase subunit D
LAVLTEKRILELGITGPNARAAGRFPDVRKALPYIGYETVDFGVPVGGRTPGQCDAHDRFIVRIREIAYSLEALRQTAETIPAGEFRNHKISPSEFVPSRGEAYSRVESARGLLGCHLVSDGGGRPCRVQFRVPSTANLSAAPELLEGARIEDIPVILASLDISVAEADK